MSVRDKLGFLNKFVKGEGVVKPNRKVLIFDPKDVKAAFAELIQNIGYENFYLSTIVGTDLKDEGKIRLDYYVVILPEEETVVFRTYLPRDSPVIDSLIDIIPGALAGECETHDLLGVVFKGNPYLRRGFFVPEDIASSGEFPLRKDSKV